MPLFDTSTLLAYLAAAVVLVLVPGPGTAWIVAQSVAGGTARGLRAGLGLETATLIHALAAGLGLSAILATSALAFDLLKYAGAAYLVWLGFRAWRATTPDAPAEAAPVTTAARSAATPTTPGPGRVYWRSVMTGVLNPKVALFFLAFLPQFIDSGAASPALAFVFLGTLFNVNSLFVNLPVAWLAARAGRRGRANPGVARMLQGAAGALFLFLAARLASLQRS